ncbi:anthranilate phosphoribosyltransferase [Aestuariirhabdus litorea]|uniref:Anthranilate phosphoribosyltransferase n=1 Tax=Aestuariirhabdus litorea TaxID=2528527 RepID=A0A3P3VL25_9GAMM|nr:anthranilate phosphoribosyltransferase [Aestuariirhabdus litorea]RRJ83380.1 anthranilate phosphoribosyltransferase [Aestuariirhabdus litorea]RWW93539.1 anthranilate phosphoribosyltransferase [Endozoicomonadaceae bacterium GTF-13]
MDIKYAISNVTEHLDLSREEMEAVMTQIMTGQCTDAQIAAFLIALRMKSESIEEITGAAKVMRELATPVVVNARPLVDIVGTGGDGANLFNVSTAASFVVAAAGGHVAKHGNRAVSSSSGSADVLEAAGIELGMSPDQVGRAVEQIGVGFMFAPAHHGAMKHAIGVRRELGLRTIFNILGPMTNPAGVKRQLIGVFSKKLCRPMAEVLKQLGSEHILVVHAEDGLDEISLATATHVAELKDGKVSEYSITPEALGIESRSLIGLEVSTAVESLDLIKEALGKEPGKNAGKAADIIALNAGAAIYVAGLSSTLADGVAMAQDAIASGLALAKISELASFSRYATQSEE